MKDEGIDFAQLLRDMADAHAKMVRTGMDLTEDRFRPALRALEREFFAAQIDPETKMKSSFTIAICNVIALLPSSITDKVNEYANAKIRGEQPAEPISLRRTGT